MQLKEYLQSRKISYAKFSELVGMSKNMIYYFSNNIRSPNKIAQLAIEYITIGEVSRKDWIKNKKENNEEQNEC